MPDMKNTNTVWLKDIPYHWGLSKINALYTLRNQKVSDRDYPPLSVTMKGILPQLDTAAKTNAHDDRKLVMKGDFAINSRSDRRGSCGISDYEGSVSLINTVMKPNGEMDPAYYNWLFHTTEFADEFYKWGHGIVDDLWTTNWQDMKHIDVPVPPLSEQHRIADFLDSKCSQIDEISKKIQEEIDTLEEYRKSVITEAVTKGLDPNVEMKDSGIEEIGYVPLSWKRIQLEHCASILRGGSPRPIEQYMSNDSTGYRWIKIGDTIKGNKYINTVRERITPAGLSKTRFVKAGTLLLTNSMSFGEPYILNVDGCIHDGWLAFSDIKYIQKEFLYYCLVSTVCKVQFDKSSDGGVVQNLNIDKVKHTIIYYPDVEMQELIINYLDERISRIDITIAAKRKQLSTLEEYKKSLIYEYVTGKKEVA